MSGMFELGSSRCLNLTAEFKFEKTDSNRQNVAPFAGPISATEMGFDGWNRATWSHILTPNHQFRRTTGI